MEDNIPLALEWKSAFETNGYKVTLCHSGDEAIAHLDETTFDLVITDMFVPKGRGGLQVIGKLLTMGEVAPPAIAVTGAVGRRTPIQETNHFLEQARRLGASASIEKPFDAPDLVFLANQFWQHLKH